MKYVIDINHPAHVHYFKNVASILQANGHEIRFTTRDRYPSLELLQSLNFNFYNRGKGSDKLVQKMLYILSADYQLLKFAYKEKPDLFLSFSTPYSHHVARLLGKPSVVFNDTENTGLHKILTYPFVDTICTPSCFKGNLGAKQIPFDGYMELSYLAEEYFSPDPKILSLLGIEPNEKYVIIRFVSWNAHHDVGHKGLTLENKIMAVKAFSEHARVFITSEGELPEELKKYQIKIPPEKMHDALYFASLLYGESATMASECAVVGTPAIYLDNEGRGYTDEQEKRYRLVYNFTESLSDQRRSIERGIELLKTPNLKEEWQRRRKKMLADKIDVTAFMVWFIENYPESARIMKETPDYQNRFK